MAMPRWSCEHEKFLFRSVLRIVNLAQLFLSCPYGKDVVRIKSDYLVAWRVVCKQHGMATW